ncbi:hypothetical protein DY000_02016959 [Brassica cretica]|uniref:Uncharacterized protein n=1 Tax=Brassica cretica TaxID=69181 RepID=A0ABQ7DC95_BRACR|nr:hypothetical protein DY000_02016959 [Brassica cretica]
MRQRQRLRNEQQLSSLTLPPPLTPKPAATKRTGLCSNQRIAARRREFRVCSPLASEMKWIVRLWRVPTDGSQVNPSQ